MVYCNLRKDNHSLEQFHENFQNSNLATFGRFEIKKTPVFAFFQGNVYIWNHENQQLVKTFEICELPVRCAKFISRKNWIVTGSDDMQIRIINYNTKDKVHSYDAHSDYIRCIVIHPVQPIVLSSSGKLS